MSKSLTHVQLDTDPD